MKSEQQTKFKDIKLFKVQQQLFNNAKKYIRKSSCNEISLKNHLSINDNITKKIRKISFNDNPIKSKEEKEKEVTEVKEVKEIKEEKEEKTPIKK